MLVLSLILPAAAAGLYRAPPEGATAVSVVLCPGRVDCTAEIGVVEGMFPGEPLVGVDSLLALNLATGGDNVSRAETFGASIQAANDAVRKQQWADATRALDAASRALAGWTGAPEPQQLFDLYYLRGCVKLAVYKVGADTFQQAAAVAWNRKVVLPVDAEPYASLYYQALYDLLNAGTGQLVLEAAPATRYLLDGVPLGEGPLSVTVFAGTHRLNAVADTADRRRAGQEWRASVRVMPAQSTTVTAVLALPDDAGWLTASLTNAVDERRMESDAGALLRDWCDHYDLRQVRLVIAEEGIEGLDGAGLRVRSVVYDPSLRRFADE